MILIDLKKKSKGTILATTSKDWVKIPKEMRPHLVQIKGHFEFDNSDQVWHLLEESL